VYDPVKWPLSPEATWAKLVKPLKLNDTLSVRSFIVRVAADANAGAHRLIDAPNAIPTYLAEFIVTLPLLAMQLERKICKQDDNVTELRRDFAAGTSIGCVGKAVGNA
jgi:hypothetical protein